MSMEKTWSQILQEERSSAWADIRVRVKGNIAAIEGAENDVGLLVAMSAIGVAYIKNRLIDGEDLETCEKIVQAAAKQAVIDATKGG